MAASAAVLPAARGTYILLFNLPAPLPLIAGRLGRAVLPAGWLLYVGSAHGAGGLRARIGRHLRPEKRPHWHIDALTGALPAQAVWYAESPERLECRWARGLLGLPGAFAPVAGFGASDCDCLSHLLSVPAPEAARRTVTGLTPGPLYSLFPENDEA